MEDKAEQVQASKQLQIADSSNPKFKDIPGGSKIKIVETWGECHKIGGYWANLLKTLDKSVSHSSNPSIQLMHLKQRD